MSADYSGVLAGCCFPSAINVFGFFVFFETSQRSEAGHSLTRGRNFLLFYWSLISSKPVFQVTEASEKMALSLDQLTADRTVLEAQVSLYNGPSHKHTHTHTPTERASGGLKQAPTRVFIQYLYVTSASLLRCER